MKLLAHTFFAATLALTVMPGCFNLDDNTQGTEGQVELSYLGSGFDCLFGCDLSEPLRLGSTQSITVSPADHTTKGSALPRLTVGSTNKGVLEVDIDDAGGDPIVKATGKAAGTATLQLFTTDGKLFDSATIRVSPAASLSLDADVQKKGSSAQTSLIAVTNLDLALGDSAVLKVNVADAKGTRLAAWGDTGLTVDDPGVAVVDTFFGSTLTAKAVGKTTLKLVLGDLTETVQVTVH